MRRISLGGHLREWLAAHGGASRSGCLTADGFLLKALPEWSSLEHSRCPLEGLLQSQSQVRVLTVQSQALAWQICMPSAYAGGHEENTLDSFALLWNNPALNATNMVFFW